MNEIYLGQRGPIAIRGVGSAARAYFGKEVHQLTMPEAALIAAIIRGPNIYSPAVDPDRAREHRNVVLAQMRDLKMITPEEFERARRAPVHVRSLVSPGQSAPYFVDSVRQELEQRFDTGVSRVRGVRIVTTLDLSLQRFAEAAAVRGLDRLESSLSPSYRRALGRRLQVAVLVVEPATGEIRALVGGRDYLASQFNRVTSARRQPGSAFKPIVYLAALRAGDGAPFFTAASRVEDLPITLESNGQPWSPRNADDRYEGIVTVRQALEQSLNSATVRIAQTRWREPSASRASSRRCPRWRSARSRSRRSSWLARIFPWRTAESDPPPSRGSARSNSARRRSSRRPRRNRCAWSRRPKPGW